MPSSPAGIEGSASRPLADSARSGSACLLGCRDEARGQAAAKRLRDAGVTADAIKFDVTRHDDHVAAFDYLERTAGHLDALINNAGVALDPSNDGDRDGANTTLTTPMALLRQTFDVNFFGMVELTQTLMPLLRNAPAGRIVNLTSILASLTLHSDPDASIYNAKSFAYDASKTAINAFTIHLAHALRDTPIKVNAAHPGWVRTDMGGPNAPLDLSEGGETSVRLATLGKDGPTGGFFHLDQRLPW